MWNYQLPFYSPFFLFSFPPSSSSKPVPCVIFPLSQKRWLQLDSEDFSGGAPSPHTHLRARISFFNPDPLSHWRSRYPPDNCALSRRVPRVSLSSQMSRENHVEIGKSNKDNRAMMIFRQL